MKLNANPIYRTLDYLWRIIVKGDKNRCEICNSKNCLDCHHIVTRGDHWLRWEPKNGVVSCRLCHKSPYKILEWLKKKYPRRYQWLMDQKIKIHRCERIDLNKIEERLRLHL